MKKLSEKFRELIRQDPRPQYVLAAETGFNPSQFNRVIRGIPFKRFHDIRFRLLANQVGYSDSNLFEDVKP